MRTRKAPATPAHPRGPRAINCLPLLLWCLCAIGAQRNALAVTVCTDGGVGCESLNGQVVFYAGSYAGMNSDPSDLSALGIGVHSGIQRIEGAMIGSAFQVPDPVTNPSVITVLRPGGAISGPANYATLKTPVQNQSNPLTLDAATSRTEVQNYSSSYPQYGYVIGGLLTSNSTSGVPQTTWAGTLSLQFDWYQSIFALDVFGINAYNPATNPSPLLFVDFFDPSGTFIDRLTVTLATLSSSPVGRSMWFQTANGSKSIAGVTLSTADNFGLGYANLTFPNPEPPTLPLCAAALTALALRRRRAQGRPLFRAAR